MIRSRYQRRPLGLGNEGKTAKGKECEVIEYLRLLNCIRTCWLDMYQNSNDITLTETYLAAIVARVTMMLSSGRETIIASPDAWVVYKE